MHVCVFMSVCVCLQNLCAYVYNQGFIFFVILRIHVYVDFFNICIYPICVQTGINLVDLVTILPFFIEVIVVAVLPGNTAESLVMVRVLRILRVFQLLKLGKGQGRAMEILKETFFRSGSLFACMFWMVLLLQVVMASLVFESESNGNCLIAYRCEGGETHLNNCTKLSYWHEEQEGTNTIALMYPGEAIAQVPSLAPLASVPDPPACGLQSVCSDYGNMCFSADGAVTEFDSIPRAIWWSLVSTTTIGFGDMYPATWLGKVFGAIGCMLGVVVFALPTTVLGLNFTKAWENFDAKEQEAKKQARNARSAELLLKALPDDVQGQDEGAGGGGGGMSLADQHETLAPKEKKRFIIDMQLAMKAVESGMTNEAIASLIGPEARHAHTPKTQLCTDFI
jgi:hypothetical protein